MSSVIKSLHLVLACPESEVNEGQEFFRTYENEADLCHL